MLLEVDRSAAAADYLSATFRLRPTRRLRFIILRPLRVCMRARNPMDLLRLILLIRCG